MWVNTYTITIFNFFYFLWLNHLSKYIILPNMYRFMAFIPKSVPGFSTTKPLHTPKYILLVNITTVI